MPRLTRWPPSFNAVFVTEMNSTVKRRSPLQQKYDFEHTPVLARVSVAAYKFGVGRTRLFDWIQKGKIKSHLVGKTRLIDLKSLEDFINSCPE